MVFIVMMTVGEGFAGKRCKKGGTSRTIGSALEAVITAVRTKSSGNACHFSVGYHYQKLLL